MVDWKKMKEESGLKKDDTSLNRIKLKATNATDSNTLYLIQEKASVLPSVGDIDEYWMKRVREELLYKHTEIDWKPFVNYTQKEMEENIGLEQQKISKIILKLERAKEYFRVADRHFDVKRNKWIAISYIYFETVEHGKALWDMYCLDIEKYKVDNPKKLYKWWKERIELLSDGKETIEFPDQNRIGFRKET